MKELQQSRILLPVILVKTLSENQMDVEQMQFNGQLPKYDEFVAKLFKTMETPALTMLHSAVGISGEAGEILDQVKKVWAYGKPLDCKNLVEELGDIRFYYQAMLNMLGLEDGDIIAANMIKLRKRYPGGEFSNAAAIACADKQAPLEPNRSLGIDEDDSEGGSHD